MAAVSGFDHEIGNLYGYARPLAFDAVTGGGAARDKYVTLVSGRFAYYSIGGEDENYTIVAPCGTKHTRLDGSAAAAFRNEIGSACHAARVAGIDGDYYEAREINTQLVMASYEGDMS